MAINIDTLLLELNTAADVEKINIKGYSDILSFPSVTELSKAIILAAKLESDKRHDVLTKTIQAIHDLVNSGYPAVTYPTIDPASITQINTEIDTEVAGIRKVMKKLGSTV
jgi:hypothetical protein